MFDMITYDEPVYRPPAEAHSVILQVTLGCSWNACAFCEMYRSKKFRVRPIVEVKNDIQLLRNMPYRVKRVFMADGNAMVLSAEKLLAILAEINLAFGRLQRISSYAMPRDILSKSSEELVALRQAGLKLLYVGIESGDDVLLEHIHKGESYKSTVEGLQKAHEAGIDTSVMVINGLGGKAFSEQHALRSAALINATAPRFLSTLTLGLPYGQGIYKERFSGDYQEMNAVELLDELELFIGHVDVPASIFRSDHVSNALVLKGTLSKDKDRLLDTILQARPLLEQMK